MEDTEQIWVDVEFSETVLYIGLFEMLQYK